MNINVKILLAGLMPKDDLSINIVAAQVLLVTGLFLHGSGSY
jgi:hypothetical protein